MRNANYSNTWVDFACSKNNKKEDIDSFEDQIGRTYNSRTLYDGMFGFGWSSGPETLLIVPGMEKEDSSHANVDGIQLIWSGAGRQEDYFAVPADGGAICYRPRAGHLGIQIRKTANGYIYTSNKGAQMEFDLGGRLLSRISKAGAPKFTMTYNGRRLLRLISSTKDELRYEYYSSGKVRHVDVLYDGNVTSSADYRYDDLENLIWVKNAWGNVYSFSYDAIHDLTKATFPDDTYIHLRYDTIHDWVTAFQDREGGVELYDYDEDRDGTEHNWSLVTKIFAGGEIVARSRYEFWYSFSEPVGNYLQRVASVVNSEFTEVSYEKLSGIPETFTKNSLTARGIWNANHDLVHVEQTRSKPPPYGGFLIRQFSMPPDSAYPHGEN